MSAGCRFGCICSIFANGRFASAIGAEFSATIELPELPVIDDSWRQNMSLSADSSTESNVDSSPHHLSSSDHIFNTTVYTSPDVTSADDMSCSSVQFHVTDKKHQGKRRLKNAQKSNKFDRHAVMPTVLFPNKRPRLKRRLSLDENSLAKSGASVVQGQLNCNLSQTLPLVSDSHRELGELQVRKHRQLKRKILPLDINDHDKVVVKKRPWKSAVSKMSQTQKKILEDATVTIAPTRVHTVRTVQGNDDKANGIHIASSVAGNSTVSSSALVPAQICLQNLSTDVLQPVPKASFI